MNKNTLGLYITDNYVYMCTNIKIYKQKIKNNIVFNNRINDANQFLFNIKQLLKKEKLNDSIKGKNLIIINQPNYLKCDRDLMISIFEKLNFNKIKFMDYTDLINKKINTINITKRNIIIFNDNNCYSLNFNLELNEDIIEMITPLFKDSKELVFIGENRLILDTINNVENKYNTHCYTYDNDEYYIIEQLQKKND